MGVGAIVGVGVNSGVGVGEGVDVGFTTGTTFTPLFQTIFFPDLMQVYFMFLAIEVTPTLLQICPLLTAANAKGWTLEINTARDNPSVNVCTRFIGKASSDTPEI